MAEGLTLYHGTGCRFACALAVTDAFRFGALGHRSRSSAGNWSP